MGTGGRVVLRRGKMDDDDDDGDEEYVVDEEDVEDDEEYVEPASACSDEDEPEPEPEDESDADFDGEEEEADEELEIEIEAPRPKPKRPAKVRVRRRKGKREDDDESDADFNGEDEEELEDDELDIDTPRPKPKRPAKVRRRGRKGKPESEEESDADFDGEDEELENEELEIETPPLHRPAKVRVRQRKGKMEDESDAGFDGEDESDAEDDELEEVEIDTPWPKCPAMVRARYRKWKPAGSRQRRHEDDDDYYEEEIEEDDEDFDPDVDEEDNDEEEEVEEDDEDLGAKKVRPRNHVVKRKTAAGRQHRKRRRRRSGSRVSKGKARKGTPACRRRRRWVTDGCEDEDEDFVVEDDVEEEVNYRPRKKAKVGRKTRDGNAESVAEGEAWPLVESDTSEFEFVTSDEEPAEKEAPMAEPARIKGKKGRRKRGSGSDSSSDSDYVISEEELKDLRVPRPPETVTQPSPLPPRRTIIPRRADEKGKELEEAMKQICGICLSEEQRATIQGVLNCCSHYFCFACILEWSKVESRCPLCKRRFNTITKSSVADRGLGLRNFAIRVSKRDQVYQPTEEEMRRWLDPYENVVCIECNQGGDDDLMLLCDICDSSAHTFCVGLGRQVPEGNWYCGGCRSSVEGPSYAQTPDRVVHRRESNTNTANSSSGSFGTAISSEVFQRPPPINAQPSLEEFDLNLSPRETPEEDNRAESHISAEPVSTPTGRHATLGRRRALNRRIRILLFRPRIETNVCQNGVEHDRTITGTEQNQLSTWTSAELGTPCSRADIMQNQQSSSQSASNLTRCTYGGGSNFREIENAKNQLIPIVKKSIKRVCAQSPLDQSAFTNVARRATNTILSLFGIAHNRDRVVATPYPFPSNCNHAFDGREPAFLMRTVCSSCFSSFVGDVVSHIANLFS